MLLPFNPYDMTFLIGMLIGLACYLGIELVNFIIEKSFRFKSDLGLLTPQEPMRKLREAVLFILAFAALYSLNSLLNNSLFSTILLLSLLPSYNFIIKPYFYLKGSKEKDASSEQFIFQKAGVKANVITSANNFSNAYAYGALPFSNLIIMSNDIEKKLGTDEKEAILLHEVAHIKGNHIVFLYMYNLLMTFGFYQLLSWLLREGTGNNLPVFLLYCATFGLIWYFLPVPLMKHFEYQADRFSAAIVGKEKYINTLIRLNDITGNALKNNDFYHPSLDSRIKNLLSKDK